MTTILFDIVDTPYQKKKAIIFFSVVVMVLFKGLRWDTGTDWDQFYQCFLNSNWDNIFTYQRYADLEEKMEPGYMFLNVLVKQFGDYTLFLLVQCGFVCTTWAYLSLKLVPDKPIMTFVMIMVFNHFFPIRLPMAAAIVCWVFYFALKRNYLASILIWFIAYTMHKSALFVFPFIFIINREYPNMLVWATLIISLLGEILANHISIIILLCSVYLPENLQANVAGYSDAEISGYMEKSMFSIISSIALSIFFIFTFLKTRELIKEEIKKTGAKIHKISLKIFNLYFNCYILMTFFFKFFSSPMLSNFSRVYEYFTLGCAVSMIISFRYLKKYVSLEILYGFFCLYYFYKLNGLLKTPFPDAMFPYKSVLW